MQAWVVVGVGGRGGGVVEMTVLVVCYPWVIHTPFSMHCSTDGKCTALYHRFAVAHCCTERQTYKNPLPD